VLPTFELRSPALVRVPLQTAANFKEWVMGCGFTYQNIKTVVWSVMMGAIAGVFVGLACILVSGASMSLETVVLVLLVLPVLVVAGGLAGFLVSVLALVSCSLIRTFKGL
jgi:hypothetical protein